jgi:hypothetical protein
VQPLDGRYGSPDNASDDASHFYFLLSSAKVGCHPAPFWLGAAAMTLIFFLFGFLYLPIASLLAFGHVDLLGFEDDAN